MGAPTPSHSFKLSWEGVQYLAENPEAVRWVESVSHPRTGFRPFLDAWYFRPEGAEPAVLGRQLWPAQERFVRAVEERDWIYFLKARKLGETTIECAYDGWVARFRDVNARVHLFSRRDDAARELLDQVKFGLEHLPSWLRLPVIQSTAHEYVMDITTAQDVGDVRRIKAYPADNETAVEASCTHGHVDEWARMGNPRKVWQAIEPTMLRSCHIVTTGLGPQNWSGRYWTRCLAGDGKHEPVFIDALQRPDRDERWLARERLSLGDETAALQEYPMRWEEALSGGGEYVFKAREIDEAGTDFRPCGPAQPGRRYSVGVDVGRHKDAAVIVVLDVTEDVHDVRHYKRMREVSYPAIQREIELVDREYRCGAALGVEANSAGEAVLENLHLSEERTKRAKFVTSHSSKARILSQLKLALQRQELKWDPEACQQLDDEMRGYQLPDDHIVQDSVIALAIAEEYAPRAHAGARLLRPFSV